MEVRIRKIKKKSGGFSLGVRVNQSKEMAVTQRSETVEGNRGERTGVTSWAEEERRKLFAGPEEQRSEEINGTNGRTVAIY